MGATAGLLTATFAASFVEFVEALTIVLAMGLARGWRSAAIGAGGAVLVLVLFTAAVGYALATWLPQAALRLVVGILLLIFGLQWLRKAILRASGLKASHDEDAEFREQTEAARRATQRRRFGLDPFGCTVSFKGVFLEGAEVVFIVITFGLNAGDLPMAIVGAGAAAVLVAGLGVLLRRPLARIPENTLKYGVGLLLASFGTFWSIGGLSAITGRDLSWPGSDWAILALIAVWFALSRLLIVVLPKIRRTIVTSPPEAVTRPC